MHLQCSGTKLPGSDIRLSSDCESKPSPPAEKPTVRVPASVCIKKGEEIRIDALLSGSPYPKVTWLKNDEDVTKEPTKKVVPLVVKRKKKTTVCPHRDAAPSSDLSELCFNCDVSLQVPEPEEEFVTPLRERLGLDQTQKGKSALMIRDSVRADHGDFTIMAENMHGVATAICNVNVLGETRERGDSSENLFIDQLLIF